MLAVRRRAAPCLVKLAGAHDEERALEPLQRKLVVANGLDRGRVREASVREGEHRRKSEGVTLVSTACLMVVAR